MTKAPDRQNKSGTLSTVGKQSVTCAACHKPGKGTLHTFRGGVYHPSCLTCTKCKCNLGAEVYAKGDERLCVKCYKTAGDVCGKCEKFVDGGVEWKDKPYHEECLICSNPECKKELFGTKMPCRFRVKDTQPYCVPCHMSFEPKCVKCKKIIKGLQTTYHANFFHTTCFICSKCKKILEPSKFLELDPLTFNCSECLADQLRYTEYQEQ